MNTIEKLVVLVDGNTIDIQHLPATMTNKEIFREAPLDEQTILIKQAKNLGNARKTELIREDIKKDEWKRIKACKSTWYSSNHFISET
ncbi:hypothetical protein Vir3643_14900 [Virgibacillus sp. CBA3643]